MMMNFNTVLLLTLIFTLSACSDAPEQEAKLPEKTTVKSNKQDHLLKGYQDDLQKAKDMGDEVQKAAEKQKKAIEEATN